MVGASVQICLIPPKPKRDLSPLLQLALQDFKPEVLILKIHTLNERLHSSESTRYRLGWSHGDEVTLMAFDCG